MSTDSPDASDLLGGATYSLVFKNNSNNSGYACVYQTDSDISDPNVLSLAWLAKSSYPATMVRFQWSLDYCFVWSETGRLVPGVQFNAAQRWDADLSTRNQVTLANNGGAFTFQNQQAGPRQGTLTIRQDGAIPLGQASVGIGMAGAGTFVRQAQPNMMISFTPHPRYWIAFGDFQAGEVLDVGEISNPYEIAFPAGVTSMTAILNADNTWSGGPTSALGDQAEAADAASEG